MFTILKPHEWLTSTLRFMPIIAVAVVAMIAIAPTDARAQAFNVFDFTCTEGAIGVNIDVRGLGNTDLCLVSTINETLDCACVGGGGNCTSDAKKQATTTTITSTQELQPENGRVFTTVTPAFTEPTSAQCNLTCPPGQTPTLIQFSASGDFRICIVGETGVCSAETCTAENAIATAEDCGPINEVKFPGKHNSCLDLFTTP